MFFKLEEETPSNEGSPPWASDPSSWRAFRFSRPDTTKKLEEKFGREKLERFLIEFNTAGRIEALTEKEGRFILRQLSLNSLRDRIFADASEANISPSAWQVQASFSRLTPTNGGSYRTRPGDHLS